MKLALAKTTFNTDPQEELAPVDVYKQTSEEVVNSYQETAEQSQGIFDGLANVDPKKLLAQATKAMATASKVAQAIARGQNSQNPIAALASGAGAIGLGGVAQSLKGLSATVGAVKNAGNAKGISQILGAATQFAGKDAAAINKLAQTATALDRNLSSFKNLQGASGINAASRQLALGAGMTSAVGSILGDMSPAMSQSYNAAANAALKITGNVQRGSNTMGKTTDPFNANVINSAIAEFKGESYEMQVTDSAGLAGSIAGLTYASNLTGLAGTFKTLTDDINDVQVCKAAAVPLAREAATVGDVNLFMDLASSKVGTQLKSAVPEIVGGMVSTVKPPADLAQQEYANLYDNFTTALKKVEPGWKSYQTKTSTYVNAAYVAQNPFMQDLVAAKMNNVMGPQGSNSQSIYPQNAIYKNSNAGVTITEDTPATTPSPTPAPQPEQTSSIEDTFLMLASVFPNESVDASVKEHFPFFYKTLDDPIMGIPI